MSMPVPTCPLCQDAQRMEQDGDFACPRCGLAGPPSVIERVTAMCDVVSTAHAVMKYYAEFETFDGEQLQSLDGALDALETLEGKAARDASTMKWRGCSVAERPTSAEFDLAERIEQELRQKPSQRPSDNAVVAMAIAEYRRGLLDLAARTERVLCDRIAEIEASGAAEESNDV